MPKVYLSDIENTALAQIKSGCGNPPCLRNKPQAERARIIQKFIDIGYLIPLGAVTVEGRKALGW